MGEYFEAVCHTCERRFRVTPSKLREIVVNPSEALKLMMWFCEHPGHEIELRGDEYNFTGEKDRADKYEVDAEIADDGDALRSIDRVETALRILQLATRAVKGESG